MLAVPVATLFAATTFVACGEDDFPNEDRPPAPIEVTANVTDRKVIVSPSKVGAGPITVTASNQSKNPATLTFDGPSPATGTSIPAGGVGSMKANFETGDYEVSGGEESDAAPGKFTVGAQRPSSQNDLLLP